LIFNWWSLFVRLAAWFQKSRVRIALLSMVRRTP
jgi:hypothetical protein